MRILIAEDDAASRRLLEATLRKWGHDVVEARDGAEAWGALEGPDAPPLAILDWMMPRMDGTEVCRRVRAARSPTPPYLILLTALGGREDVVAGLTAGADDYINKPFDREELHARVQAGVRIVELQRTLAARVYDLEEALGRVKQLQGLLPICSYCKKVRKDGDYWQQVETYVAEHSEARFSHGICPACWEAEVKPQLDQMRGRVPSGPAPAA